MEFLVGTAPIPVPAAESGVEVTCFRQRNRLDGLFLDGLFLDPGLCFC